MYWGSCASEGSHYYQPLSCVLECGDESPHSQ